MPIPKYHEFFLPILKILADGKNHTKRDIKEILTSILRLNEPELKELLPSGRQTIVDSRVGWALTYMRKAGLLDSPKRGLVIINQRGLDFLQKYPTCITVKDLEQFPEFMEFRYRKKDINFSESDNDGPCQDLEKTPSETIDNAFQTLTYQLASELLEQVKSIHPGNFEKLVIDLLLAMGYGGTRKDAGEAIGRSGDEGIDGKIYEDRLGLDTIYIQAKRWEGSVGRPDIQKFAGALQGQKAKKGVYITTSDFTSEAKDFASKIENKIVLINGEQLAQYMINFNIGVSIEETYEIKKIDLDYFEEI